MKKLTSALLALILCLSLAACAPGRTLRCHPPLSRQLWRKRRQRRCRPSRLHHRHRRRSRRHPRLQRPRQRRPRPRLTLPNRRRHLHLIRLPRRHQPRRRHPHLSRYKSPHPRPLQRRLHPPRLHSPPQGRAERRAGSECTLTGERRKPGLDTHPRRYPLSQPFRLQRHDRPHPGLRGDRPGQRLYALRALLVMKKLAHRQAR